MNPLIEESPLAATPVHSGATETDNTMVGRPPIIQPRFSAGEGGPGTATHGSIEHVLKTAGFREHEVRAIYFGNWLRDYSQLLDPKIVRATSMPKSFPDLLSRDALTKVVDVLAIREFNDLMQVDRERFRVTAQRLGVYRPSEHIDNPKVTAPEPANPQSRDSDFEPWVLDGDALLKVDYQTSMKRYIQRSTATMKSQLDSASSAGLESTDGLRAFGSALHILEDFFSHSNFAELSLIKLGYTDVLPWTSKADCSHGLPLVTGMFGSTDVIASLAAPIGKILFSVKDTIFTPIQSGERYEKDQIIQILLSEHPDERLLSAYEGFLKVRDTWADLPYSSYLQELNHHLALPGQLFNNAIGYVMQALLTVVGNSIGPAQTLITGDPNSNGSTDPSHSQLAKDHAEHPLHELAALLAQEAVEHLGFVMLEHWLGRSGAGDPGVVAAAYITHANDSSWQDDIVRKWAAENPQQVKKAASKNELANVAEKVRGQAMQELENLNSQGTHFLETFLTEDNALLRLWKLTPLGWYLTRRK
ncbi:HET-C-related protein [Pseudomonas caspiana]|uniref:HET-C-related protein n=1 Tax=Pseudomonas caspiana TaxID=1451454 RepID=UPI0035562DDD